MKTIRKKRQKDLKRSTHQMSFFMVFTMKKKDSLEILMKAVMTEYISVLQ